jgi:hypothetical protein
MSFSIKKTHGTLKRLSISGEENTNNILNLLAQEAKSTSDSKTENKNVKETTNQILNQPQPPKSGFSMKKTTVDYCSDYL